MSQHKFDVLQFLLGVVGVVGTGIILLRGVADHRAIDGHAVATIVFFAVCTYNLSHGLAGLLGKGRQ